jgi:hypothetical protein
MLMDGWVPAGIALGISAGEDGARLGADGAVVFAMSLHVRSDECHAHLIGADHFAEAVITGTAVARSADRGNGRDPSC